MTPKSLLRNKYCVSELKDFSKENSFHRVMWDHSMDPKSKGFIKLKENHENLRLVIVPRHPERSASVLKICLENGIESEISSN